MYEDDICVLDSAASAMQYLLDVCEKFMIMVLNMIIYLMLLNQSALY